MSGTQRRKACQGATWLGVLSGLILVVLIAPSAAAQGSGSPPVHVGPPTAAGTIVSDSGEVGPAMGLALAGPVNLATPATAVISLPVRDPALLQIFDEEVSEPGSPVYLQFLTPSEFESDFGPAPAVMDAVEGWLVSSGLQLTYISPSGTEIDASGSLEAFESAFGTTFSNYRSSGGAVYWAANSNPQVPPAIAPDLSGIAGLTDAPADVSFPLAHLAPSASPDAVYEGTGNLDSFAMNHQILQLDQMYNVTGNKTAGNEPSYPVGTVVSQGLWSTSGYCGYSTTDLNTFFNTSDGYPSDLPKPVIENHYLLGGTDEGAAPSTGNCGGTVADDTAAIELTLDLQSSGTDAPGATLEPTWTGGATDADLEHMDSWAVSDIPGLDAFTQSWGGGEAANSTGSFERDLQTDFDEANAEGVSLFVSSADSDGADGGSCAAPTEPALEFPGSSPNVLSVGAFANNNTGESTYEDLDGANVWNWCGGYDELVGSTGGVSEAFPAAWYQVETAVNTSMSKAITYYQAHGGTVYSASSARPDPDWSGAGANMELYFSGAWQQGFGGTSFSSPATAGLLDSVMAFVGHRIGQVAPLLYEFENEYYNHVGGILRPTYSINNGSNALFEGSTYSTATGWGAPMALNFSEDLGKPFIATNPESEPQVGTAYAITATVKDIQAVSKVDVAYLAPGGTGADWANLSLSLSSGSNVNGVWTGSIPATALTETGDLRYCVYAVDATAGNSWSPYNMSAWAATESQAPTNNFGCTVPFKTYVQSVSSPLTAGSAVLNYTDAKCETTCAVELNASFSGGTGPFSAAAIWSSTAHSNLASVPGTPARFFFNYSTAGSYPITVYVDGAGAANVSEAVTVTVYNHIEVSSLVPSVWHAPSPLNETGYTPTFTGGPSGSGPISVYAWRYGNGFTSAAASPGGQVYYLDGTYTTTLNVTDSLGYRASGTVSVAVSGSPFNIVLYTGWNFIALPFSACSTCSPTYTPAFTLYNLAETVGYPTLLALQDVRGTTTTTYSGNGAFAVNPGDGVWVDVSAGKTITLYGNTSATTLAGEAYTSDEWSAVGWSVSSATTAQALGGQLTGAESVSVWNAQTQAWVSYVVNFDTSSEYDFAISAGQAVQVYCASTGTFTE